MCQCHPPLGLTGSRQKQTTCTPAVTKIQTISIDISNSVRMKATTGTPETAGSQTASETPVIAGTSAI